MAHSKQAQKRTRQNEKAKQANKATRGAMRTAEKKVRRATGEEATAALPKAQSRIDKSAKNGVLHKNAAARRKSRLAKAANQLAAAK
jgi:small subunit ribosomal protein S20